MAKILYDVLVTADTTVSATVWVEANNPTEAEDLAIEIALGNPDLKWERDDGNPLEPYIGDPGNSVRLVSNPL